MADVINTYCFYNCPVIPNWTQQANGTMKSQLGYHFGPDYFYGIHVYIIDRTIEWNRTWRLKQKTSLRSSRPSLDVYKS